MNFDLDLDKGKVTLEYLENVDLGSVNFSKIRVQDSNSSTPANSVQLTNPVLRRRAEGHHTVLEISLSETDLNLIKVNPNLGKTIENTFVAMEPGAVVDPAGRPSPLAVKQAGAVTSDSTRPRITGFFLNLQQGFMILSFSEPVLTTPVNLTGIRLLNSGFQATSSLALSGGQVQRVNVTALRITMLVSDLTILRQTRTLAFSRGSTFLAVAAGAMQDMAGNPSHEVPVEGALLANDMITSDAGKSSSTQYSVAEKVLIGVALSLFLALVLIVLYVFPKWQGDGIGSLASLKGGSASYSPAFWEERAAEGITNVETAEFNLEWDNSGISNRPSMVQQLDMIDAAPMHQLQPLQSLLYAQYGYEAAAQDELSYKAGDEFLFHTEGTGPHLGWAWVRNGFGVVGLVCFRNMSAESPEYAEHRDGHVRVTNPEVGRNERIKGEKKEEKGQFIFLKKHCAAHMHVVWFLFPGAGSKEHEASAESDLHGHLCCANYRHAGVMRVPDLVESACRQRKNEQMNVPMNK